MDKDFNTEFSAVFSQFNPTYQAIFLATNSHNMPSDTIISRTEGQKALSIAAFEQEMTLAGLLYSQRRGNVISPTTFAAVEGGLAAVYKQAGFSDPSSLVDVAKQQLKERIDIILGHSRSK